jgi:hypothetical protein
MDESDVLKDLRSLILAKAGIRNITPADCKTISIEISKTLHKNVSETTIKRLFGFAMVRHNFSKFTLTTLSDYVNDQSLLSAINHSDNQDEGYDLHWKDVEQRTRRISDFTIKSIKNRSGIPYDMTVRRKFSEHDFDDFYKSDYSFMAFISQPGYGKTIILAHLAEKILASKALAAQGTTLVFITAYNLINKNNTQASFELQLKSMLGINTSESLVGYINKTYKLTDGKLLIFLDGFAEVVLKREARNQMFDGIIDFLCSIEDSNSVKLVMNMRSTTWSHFYEKIRNSTYLKKKWFQGNYFNLNDCSNVPPLNEKEVDMIMKRIEQPELKIINPRLKGQLKFPFHIQLYYQLKEEDPTFNYSSNITFYELISRFIQDKIYKSNYYTEKILFLKKVIQLTDFGAKHHSVSKDDLIAELSAFKNAYSDLLSDGILMEERFLDSYHPKEYVRFIHPHLFEYFLFIELLEMFQLKMEKDFFNHLHKKYNDSPARFHILQWTIRFMVRMGNFEYINSVFELSLTRYEVNYLILYIAENLDYREKYTPERIDGKQMNFLYQAITKELLAFDFTDLCYKEAIQSFVKITHDEEYLLIYKSFLGVYSYLELDIAALQLMEKDLPKYRSLIWNNNPATIATVALHTIEKSPINDVDLIKRLEDIMIWEPLNALNIDDAISSIYILHCMLLMDKSDQAIKFLAKLSVKFDPVNQCKNPFTNLFIGLKELVMAINNVRSTVLRENEEVTIIEYADLINKLTQAYRLFHSGNYSASINITTGCLALSKERDLHLISLLAYNLLILDHKGLMETAKLNELMYERLCLMEDLKLSTRMLTPLSA